MNDYCPPTDKLHMNASYLRSRAAIMRDSNFAHELKFMETTLSHLKTINDLLCSQFKIYKNSDITFTQYSQHIISDEKETLADFLVLEQNFAIISYKNIHVQVSLTNEETILSCDYVSASDLPDNFEEEILLPLLIKAQRQQLREDILLNQLNVKSTSYLENDIISKSTELTPPHFNDSRQYEPLIMRERQIVTAVKRTRLPVRLDEIHSLTLPELMGSFNALIVSSSPHFRAGEGFLRDPQ